MKINTVDLRKGDVIVMSVPTGNIPNSKIEKFLQQVTARMKTVFSDNKILVIADNGPTTITIVKNAAPELLCLDEVIREKQRAS